METDSIDPTDSTDAGRHRSMPVNDAPVFAGAPAAPDGTDVPAMPVVPAEPDPSTQEMTAAHARSYAQAVPHPTGAAAAAAPPQIPLAPAKRVQAQFNPLADGMVYLVVFLGGCVGTALRYGLTLLMPAPAAAHGFFSAFHPATFTANMLACFIFATITAYVSQASWVRKRVRQLASRGIGMGLCGGFSTLSAMVIEELASIQDGQIGGFLFYMLFSFICGMSAAWLGVRLAFALSARRSAGVVAAAVAAASGQPRHADPSGRSGRLSRLNKSDDKPVIAVGDPMSGPVEIKASAPPEGDYGQPLAGAAPVASTAGSSPAGSLATGSLATGSLAAGSSAADSPSFEPAPITDEIPMVGDPSTGEVSVDTAGTGQRGRHGEVRA